VKISGFSGFSRKFSGFFPKHNPNPGPPECWESLNNMRFHPLDVPRTFLWYLEVFCVAWLPPRMSYVILEKNPENREIPKIPNKIPKSRAPDCPESEYILFFHPISLPCPEMFQTSFCDSLSDVLKKNLGIFTKIPKISKFSRKKSRSRKIIFFLENITKYLKHIRRWASNSFWALRTVHLKIRSFYVQKKI